MGIGTRLWEYSPFGVFVHVGVALYGVFFDEELDALVEGGGDGGRLFAQKDLDGVVGREAHDVLGAFGPAAAFRVRAVRHAIFKMVVTLSDDCFSFLFCV